MAIRPTENINVRSFLRLTSPREIKAELPLTERAAEAVLAGRDAVRRIVAGEDARLIVIVGPCSIHNERSALEYAERLRALAERTREQFLLVMRVYFEKPRTVLGWKGLTNDPHLDGSFDIEAGLRIGRRLLIRIAEMGLPAATEMLEPIIPQYIADVVSWASIGARTIESQTHRQLASGLSMPVGFKNPTSGHLQIAVEALETARHPHAFLGIDADGCSAIIHTVGNPWGHLILRGGRSGPNYDAVSIAGATGLLRARGLPPSIVIDCSHANSNKDYRNQAGVFADVIEQRLAGNRDLIGLMLESNLKEGRQPVDADPSKLAYGVSITDGCIGWDETEALLTGAAEALRSRAAAACR